MENWNCPNQTEQAVDITAMFPENDVPLFPNFISNLFLLVQKNILSE